MQYVALLNQFGEGLIGRLGPLSIELVVWAAFIQLLIWGLRIKSPALKHGLWVLVLAKPFITLLVASPVSLYGLVPEFGRETAPAVSSTTHIVTPVAAMASLPVQLDVELNHYGFAGLVWMAIAAALVLRLLVGQILVWNLRRKAQILSSGSLDELMRQASADVGTRRRVHVALSDEIQGPLLTGFIRPLILLPRKIASHFSTEQIKLVLAHELAHVRRFDNLVLLIQRLVETALFFHPVTWICGRNLRREAEKACDDSVIHRYPDPVRYAESLTRIAEIRSGLRYGLLVHTFAQEESQFVQRVRRILVGYKVPGRVGLNAVSILLLIVVGCIGLPRHASPGQSGQTEKVREVVGGNADTLAVAITERDTSASDLSKERALYAGHLGDTLYLYLESEPFHLGGTLSPRLESEPFRQTKAVGTTKMVLVESASRVIFPPLQPHPAKTGGKVKVFTIGISADSMSLNDPEMYIDADTLDANPAHDRIQVLRKVLGLSPAVVDMADTMVARAYKEELQWLMEKDTVTVYYGKNKNSHVSMFPTEPNVPISFEVPTKDEVKLLIYDHKGNPVRTMVNATLERGDYTLLWDGLNDKGQTVEEGVYFYRLSIGSETAVKKLTTISYPEN